MDVSKSLLLARRRGDLNEPECESRGVLEHVTSRWGVLALIALLEGTHRFSELRRRIGGVSEKMLAQTLQALESDGFVVRVALPVIPPHVEYSLSPMGRDVAEHVAALAEWIERSMPRVTKARAQVAAKKVAAAKSA
jgi:DNA-binding HxlR family transcriptional regulator